MFVNKYYYILINMFLLVDPFCYKRRIFDSKFLSYIYLQSPIKVGLPTVLCFNMFPFRRPSVFTKTSLSLLALLHASRIRRRNVRRRSTRRTYPCTIKEHATSSCCDSSMVGNSPNQSSKLKLIEFLRSLWRYLIFYTPIDIGYKIAKFLPVKVVCSAMKEIYRCKKVYDGVSHAAKIYPNAYIIMVIIGTLKGNGAGFTRLIERLIRGVWTPTAMEFMQPSL